VCDNNGEPGEGTRAVPRAERVGQAKEPAARDKSLSEESIVEAALQLIRRRGVDNLTMRELADELGVSPMAPYYYVGSKDDLLASVQNAVLARVEVPPPESGTWAERLRLLTRARRRALAQYPGLSDHGLDTEQNRRLEDASLEILLEAGFTPAQAVPAFRTLLSWLQGHIRIETMLRDPHQRRAKADWTKAQLLTFDRDVMPELHADDYFEFGLDAVIIGLEAVLERGEDPTGRASR
jgi:AcrR family transcriptional regulator